MPLGDLLHAYSYTYADQVLDGIHGEQSIVPPHLIDFTQVLDDSHEDTAEQPQAAESSHSSRSTYPTHNSHVQTLRDLKLRRRELAKEARRASEASNSKPSTKRRSSNQNQKREAQADDNATQAGRPSLNTGKPSYTPPTAASFYIPTLPGLPADSTLTLFGGHLPSTVTSSSILGIDDDGSDDPSDAHLFFFLAKAKHIDQSQKLVIWLNGGPGCSSFDGALMEIGPLRMVEGKKGELYEQDGAWNEYANVMFIDQPAGTGYSYVSHAQYVHSGEDAAKQVVTFLKNFYEVFPEYQKMDTYIAGESFAGIWIPYIANELQNTKLVSPPLKGLLIGNGWIDPFNQYPAYVDFSYSEDLLKEGTTPVAGLNKVKRVLDRCNRERERIGFEKFPINHGPCEAILSTITETTIQTVNGQKLCVNNYDIRLTDSHPSCGMNWPNLLPDMYSYLPRQDVVNAFHASARKGKWAECSGRVSDSFWGHTKPSVHLLPRLLESGLPILLFSGMQDLICNHVGTEKMIENMTWSGATGWGSADVGDLDIESEDLAPIGGADLGPQTWWVDGKKAGTWQTARNLTYVQVYNSSHMVPFDLPVVAHDMLSRFIGTDYFSAAGASAKVPSRIGNEQAAIIGETHLNGSALDSTSQKQSTDLDGTQPLDGKPENPVADAYYNIGAAILILFVLILAGAAFIWRQRRKRAHRYGGFGSGSQKGAGLPTSIANGQSRRGRTSVSDYRRTAGDTEEANELLPMEQREGDDTSLAARSSHNQLARGSDRHHDELPKGEELFSVGEEDEDDIDSEEEGNISRPGRKFSALSDDVNGGESDSKERYDV